MRASREAVRAIARGIQRGDAVARMEFLGLECRTINALENEAGIVWLVDLIQVRRSFLMRLPGINHVTCDHILACLMRYHELDALDPDFNVNGVEGHHTGEQRATGRELCGVRPGRT